MVGAAVAGVVDGLAGKGVAESIGAGAEPATGVRIIDRAASAMTGGADAAWARLALRRP